VFPTLFQVAVVLAVIAVLVRGGQVVAVLEEQMLARRTQVVEAVDLKDFRLVEVEAQA